MIILGKPVIYNIHEDVYGLRQESFPNVAAV